MENNFCEKLKLIVFIQNRGKHKYAIHTHTHMQMYRCSLFVLHFQ